VKQIIEHEGIRLKPYLDTVGKWTIGVGRNLSDKGISREEAMMLLYNDIDDVLREIEKRIPFWSRLSDARQMVLADMAFNLGVSGLLGFKKMLAALEDGDYETARCEMLASKWARQVKGRALKLARMMREG